MTDAPQNLDDLNARSREVFRRVVEGYLETGDPVGSRTLTRTLTEQVSAATVRNLAWGFFLPIHRMDRTSSS